MNSIQFQPLTNNHFKGTMVLLLEHFFLREPMSVLLELTKGEIIGFLDVVLQKAIKDELSVIAVNGSNEVVGCIISDDYFSIPDAHQTEITQKLDPIFLLLEKLGDAFMTSCIPETNNYYHLFMIATNKKGIAAQLTDKALKLAKSKGFKYAVLEATGAISQHIAENSLQFKEIATVKYKDFEFKGKKIFESIEGTDACKLYSKEIC